MFCRSRTGTSHRVERLEHLWGMPPTVLTWIWWRSAGNVEQVDVESITLTITDKVVNVPLFIFILQTVASAAIDRHIIKRNPVHQQKNVILRSLLRLPTSISLQKVTFPSPSCQKVWQFIAPSEKMPQVDSNLKTVSEVVLELLRWS